jgi:predicted O-methyltransferase YrrM
MEHFYQKINGWFTFSNFYTTAVSQAKSGMHFVEVGTWKGMSAAFMAVEILNSNKHIKFDCVDTWNGSEEHTDKNSPFYEPLLEVTDGLYNHCVSNLKPVENVVNLIRLPSLKAVEKYSDGTLDFVFIDAAHDYDNVVADIKAWLPKVKPGGILAGHDINHQPIKNATADTLGEVNSIFAEDVWYYKVK